MSAIPHFPARNRFPPSPKGRLRELVRNPLSFFLALVRQHGDIVCYRTAPEPAYLINHPQYIKHVLVDNSRNYTKETYINRMFKSVVADGLLTSEGEAWRQQRQLLQPAFHPRNLTFLDAIVTGATEAMLRQWQEQASQYRPIDVTKEMASLTLSITTQALFGVDLGQDVYVVGQAVNMAADLLEKPTSPRFKTAREAVDQVVQRIIREKQRAVDHRQDLLSILLQAYDQAPGTDHGYQQLCSQVTTLLLAGYDTTASALSWTWCLLARHPRVMQSLRAEVENVLAGRKPTYQDLERLTYTHMVFEESMRLYPPAWILGRKAIQADVIGGFDVPAGTIVAISPYTVHRHPDFWDDPEEFRPERFASRPSAQRHGFAYIPFGGGQRTCIGNHFAQFEAQLIIAMIVQAFNLELLPDQTIKPEPLFILRPTPPVYCQVTPIR